MEIVRDRHEIAKLPGVEHRKPLRHGDHLRIGYSQPARFGAKSPAIAEIIAEARSAGIQPLVP
jgi:hypothetical protein